MSNFALLIIGAIGGASLVGGCVLALLAMRGAPDGFEDQEGFHSGVAPGARTVGARIKSRKVRR